jgi:hypothetical protein
LGLGVTAMTVHANFRDLFARFQNLNLLALLHDLRSGATTRRGWSFGGLLCPVAHGMPAGRQVRVLSAMGQTAGLERSCDYAAHEIGASPAEVLQFVSAWDDNLDDDWLLQQLEAIWQERLEDAEAMQALLLESEDSFLNDPEANDISASERQAAKAIP